jgi:hypothetical protein
MTHKTAVPVVKDNIDKFWDILKSMVSFLGIYLFFIGWTYLFYYFKTFGISQVNIQLDIVTYYHYGFFNLVSWNLFSVFAIAAAILTILYYRREKIKYFFLLVMLVFLSIFLASYYLIMQMAADNATAIIKQERFKRWPTYFEFTSAFFESVNNDSVIKRINSSDSIPSTPASDNVRKLLRLNRDRQLYNIFENKDFWYVVYNPNPKGETSYCLEFFMIKKTDVAYIINTIDYTKKSKP